MSRRELMVTAHFVLGLAFAGFSPLEAVAQSGRARIAVVSFANNSTFDYWGNQLGDAAADELTTQLVNSGAFTVIERRQIQELLDEQTLGMSGAVDPATAAQLGGLLGVQVVLTGSITKFSLDRRSGGIGRLRASYTEAEVVLDIRVVDTSTGEILLVAEGEGKKRLGGVSVDDLDFERTFDAGIAQESLRPAVEKAVERIVDQRERFAALAPVTPPASIVGAPDAQTVYIDQGENLGVQVGQRYEVHRVVDEIRDGSGNVLDRITEKVGVIEVTRVLSQSSICTVVEGEAAEGDQLKAL